MIYEARVDPRARVGTQGGDLCLLALWLLARSLSLSLSSTQLSLALFLYLYIALSLSLYCSLSISLALSLLSLSHSLSLSRAIFSPALTDSSIFFPLLSRLQRPHMYADINTCADMLTAGPLKTYTENYK